MNYKRKGKDRHPQTGYPTVWITEMALWTAWTVNGDLQCATECRLISLDAGHFGEVISQFCDAWRKTSRYAIVFLKALNAVDNDDISDLDMPAISGCNIMDQCRNSTGCLD